MNDGLSRTGRNLLPNLTFPLKHYCLGTRTHMLGKTQNILTGSVIALSPRLHKIACSHVILEDLVNRKLRLSLTQSDR